MKKKEIINYMVFITVFSILLLPTITIIISVFLKHTFFFFVRVRLDGMIQSLINTKLVK